MEQTVQRAGEIPNFPVLKIQMKIHSQGTEGGYIETEKQLMRVQSSFLPAVGQHLLPLLDGRHSVEEIVQKTAPHLSEQECMGVLQAFAEQGMIGEQEEVQQRTAKVIVLGQGQLAKQLVEALQEVQALQVMGWLREDSDWQTMLRDQEGLVVVVSDAVQDPLFYEVNAWCVQMGRVCLFVGLERQDLGFVGPLWHKGDALPCYHCLQTRLNMNLPEGKIRAEFGQWVRQSKQRPVEQTTKIAWVRMIAAAAADAIEQSSQNATTSAWRGHVQFLTEQQGQAVWEDHRLLAVPKCPVCYEHQKEDVKGREWPNDLRAAVDAKVGIVHDAYAVEFASSSDIKTENFAGVLSNLSFLNPAMSVMVTSGAGFQTIEAYSAAVGEAVERYGSCLYDPKELLLTTWEDLEGEKIALEHLRWFSEEQYRQDSFTYQAITQETKLRWVQAESLVDGQKVWVPAAMVYLPYRVHKEEAKMMPSISTGLAAGPTFESAVLTSLYEVLERDAFTISWLNRIPPRAIDPQWLSQIDSLEAFPKQAGYRYQVFDMSLDLPVPVIFARMEHPDGTLMTVGGACRLDPVKAIEKALLEAAQSPPYIHDLLQRFQDWQVDESFGNVDTFQKHAMFYTKYPALREQAGFLVHPQVEQQMERREANLYHSQSPDVKADLQTLVHLLAQKGHQVLVVDLTPPDLKQIGVAVARVIVPGMQHLMGHHRYRMLGNQRLYDVPKQLGLSAQPDNPYPHPYP